MMTKKKRTMLAQIPRSLPIFPPLVNTRVLCQVLVYTCIKLDLRERPAARGQIRCPNGKRPTQITSGGTHVAIEYCPVGRNSPLNCVPQRRMSSPSQISLLAAAGLVSNHLSSRSMVLTSLVPSPS